MKKSEILSVTNWNVILFVSVIAAVFAVPVLPVHVHELTFSLVYSVIYIAAIFSLEKRSKAFLSLFFATFILHWVSAIFSFELLNDISKGFNVLFFLFVVFKLIHQIATAKEVSAKVIVSSVAGYLLTGIVFSFFIVFIIRVVPGAYSSQMTENVVQGIQLDASPPFYYTFVTLASLGYGDIVPLKPVSRSLATLIAVTGQFYIAVLVALLVGKFSARQNSK